MAHLFARRERKTVLVICAKKLTKLPSGGLNRGPSPSYPQQMPLGWPRRPSQTAHFCSAIFLCQCHTVGPSIGVAARGPWVADQCQLRDTTRQLAAPDDAGAGGGEAAGTRSAPRTGPRCGLLLWRGGGAPDSSDCVSHTPSPPLGPGGRAERARVAGGWGAGEAPALALGRAAQHATRRPWAQYAPALPPSRSTRRCPHPTRQFPLRAAGGGELRFPRARSSIAVAQLLRRTMATVGRQHAGRAR